MSGAGPAPVSHRIIVRRRGGPDVLEFRPGDRPEPAEGEALVRVEAAGVSAYDVMLRAHRFPGFPSLPYTPGEDVVGIVEATGANVTEVSVGQRVAAWTFGEAGGYAEHICRPAAQLAPTPDGLDPAIAAALIVNGLTAHLALHAAVGIEEGEKLLVQGAGGGLGSMLLQLARRAGAETFGCDAKMKHDQIMTDGAAPIDFRDRQIVDTIRKRSHGGVDAVVDVVGGAGQLLQSYRVLRPGGRLLMLGMAGTASHGVGIILPSLLMTALLALWPDRRRIATGPGMESYPQQHLAWYRGTLKEIFDLAVRDELDPHIAARIPLRDAARAHRMLKAGQAAGKVVLVAGGSEAL